MIPEPVTEDSAADAAAWAGSWAEALCGPGYGVFPDAAPGCLVQGLRDTLALAAPESSPSWRQARTGRGEGLERRPEIRSDEIRWLDPSGASPAEAAWLEWMEAVRRPLREALRLPLDHYEGHLARYRAGGFYRPHLDQHAGTAVRQITVILYLNPDWHPGDGGQLRLYTDPAAATDGPFRDVEPRAGTVVVFRSADFWHEVLPAHRDRLSLTGWLRLAAASA
jgi:SM-20-related protein